MKIKITSLCVVGIVTMCAVRHCISNRLPQGHILVARHASLTAYAHDYLSRSLREYEKISLPVDTLVDQVRALFPFFDSVVAQKDALGTTHVHVQMVKPLIALNQQHVLTQKGLVVSKHYFPSPVFKGLPHIELKDVNSNLDRHCINFLTRMPHHFFERFYVKWINHTHVMLEDKDHPRFAAIGDGHTVYNDAWYARYAYVRDAIKKPPSSFSYVDMRFNNQVIVYSGLRRLG